MAFTLPELPYSLDALEPHISASTRHFHHAKHHVTYVTKLNELIRDTELEHRSLGKIILTTATDPPSRHTFNNAAQVWNHTFYWHSMKPGGGGRPDGELAGQIERGFDGFGNFAAAFRNAATSQFGSGWVWLVLDDGKLAVTQTRRSAGESPCPLSAGFVFGFRGTIACAPLQTVRR